MSNPSVKSERDDLVLEVVGKRPENEPYLWIGNQAKDYIASFDEKAMRKLRTAITEALGDD